MVSAARGKRPVTRRVRAALAGMALGDTGPAVDDEEGECGNSVAQGRPG